MTGARGAPDDVSRPAADDSSEQALHRDDAVEAAGAEALEVQGDELEAQGAEGGDQLAADIQVHQAGQVVQRDLDAGQVALVVADPQDAQALLPQPLLGLVDHADALGGDLFAVGAPGGQAGGCGGSWGSRTRRWGSPGAGWRAAAPAPRPPRARPRAACRRPP